jgi:hypothetical protein
MNEMLETIEAFVSRCQSLGEISDAYDVFEFECSPVLRDQIYALGGEDDPEPFRSAMHELGFRNY